MLETLRHIGRLKFYDLKWMEENDMIHAEEWWKCFKWCMVFMTQSILFLFMITNAQSSKVIESGAYIWTHCFSCIVPMKTWCPLLHKEAVSLCWFTSVLKVCGKYWQILCRGKVVLTPLALVRSRALVESLLFNRWSSKWTTFLVIWTLCMVS